MDKQFGRARASVDVKSGVAEISGTIWSARYNLDELRAWEAFYRNSLSRVAERNRDGYDDMLRAVRWSRLVIEDD